MIRSLRQLPYDYDLDRDRYVVTETGQQIKAVKIGDIIDFVVSEAKEELSKSTDNPTYVTSIKTVTPKGPNTLAIGDTVRFKGFSSIDEDKDFVVKEPKKGGEGFTVEEVRPL